MTRVLALIAAAAAVSALCLVMIAVLAADVLADRIRTRHIGYEALRDVIADAGPRVPAPRDPEQRGFELHPVSRSSVQKRERPDNGIADPLREG